MSKVSATRLVTLCLLLMVAVLSPAVRAATVDVTMNVPNGSYMLTCIKCSLTTVTYSCQCKNDNHTYVSSSISLSTCTQASDGFFYLTNQNGKLTCSTS